jgi:hypothetical protein
MRDRINSNRLCETIPAGLSQVSHVPDEDDDWIHAMEEVSDVDDYGDSRKVLSRHYYNEVSEAFNNSKEKETLETEFKIVMNQFTVRARGGAALTSSLVGQRVSNAPC